MPIDPIGSRPQGMDDVSQPEPSLEPDAQRVQGPTAAKSTGEALGGALIPAGSEVQAKTTPFTSAEAGTDRLGESKFQGMVIRDKLIIRDKLQTASGGMISQPADGVWAEKFGAGGLDVQDKLSFPKEVVSNKKFMTTGGLDVQEKLSFPKETAVKFWEPAQQAGLDVQDKLSFPKQTVSSKLELDVQEKLSFPKQTVSLKYWTPGIEADKENPRGADDKELAVSENLVGASQSSIWGERLGGSDKQAGLNVQEKLSFPKQTTYKLEETGLPAGLDVQDKLSFPKQTAAFLDGIQDKLSFPKQTATFFDGIQDKISFGKVGQEYQHTQAEDSVVIQDKLSFPKQTVLLAEDKLEDQTSAKVEPEIKDKLRFPK